ncbi:MAG: hypothetical protein QM725_05895 [Lacibacter sp.]
MKTSLTILFLSCLLFKGNHLSDFSNDITGKSTTIVVSYAAIACGCPQWFETKFSKIPFLEGVERFYLEPSNKKLINANDLYDGENLPLTIKLIGQFSKEKLLPVTYNSKDELIRARIFWYNKITIVSPAYNGKFK